MKKLFFLCFMMGTSCSFYMRPKMATSPITALPAGYLPTTMAEASVDTIAQLNKFGVTLNGQHDKKLDAVAAKIGFTKIVTGQHVSDSLLEQIQKENNTSGTLRFRVYEQHQVTEVIDDKSPFNCMRDPSKTLSFDDEPPQVQEGGYNPGYAGRSPTKSEFDSGAKCTEVFGLNPYAPKIIRKFLRKSAEDFSSHGNLDGATYGIAFVKGKGYGGKSLGLSIVYVSK